MSNKNGNNRKMETYKTGEYGFCERCGDVRRVEILPSDRLQNRLRKAYAALAAKQQRSVKEQLEYDLTNALWAMQNPNLDLLDTPKSSRAILEKLITVVIALEGELSDRLGEPVDLLREATEWLEGKLDDWDVEGVPV